MQRVIDINQVRGNFFGGLPYNISWSFGGGEEPSKLNVSVVNENGVYATPTPTFNKTENIKIGNFSFEGYLVSYSIKQSPNQKILDLEYVDKAINLEKWFVGLHTKHGNKYQNNINRLILVGKPYHPCDTNLDSEISFSEGGQLQIDYCDPCPFMPEDKYDSACDPILSEFEIFDVYYTFNELISKIPSEFKVDIKNASKYNKFKSQHIGSLKNVLSSWCNDLGLSFYWDPFLSKLIFLDRSAPIKIPPPPTNWEIIDLNVGKSILNTFSRGFIGNYEKAGEIKNYNCSDESIETVRCLNIADLYEQKSTGFSNEEAPNESDIRELTAAISYLGVDARNAFLWFWYFQINSANDLKNKYLLPYKIESKTESEKSKGKILKYLGDMKIRAVYHTGGTPEEVENFYACKKRLQQADIDYMDADDKKKGYTTASPSYYFFVAEMNESLASEQADNDVDIAKNFMGRYWFKKFKANIPGASNSNSEVNVESPDGSVSWHRVDDDLKGLPIFNFGHEEKSKVGKLFKEIEKDAKENEQLEQQYREAVKSFTQSKISLKSLNSFILLERDGKWFPNEDFLVNYNSLFQWFKEVSPRVFSSEDGRPEFLFQLHPEAKSNPAVKLFVVRDLSKQGGLQTEFSIEQHPLEPKTRKQRTEEQQDVLGNTVIIKKGPWGIREPKAVKIKFGGDRGITFFCPAQAFGNNKIVKNESRDKTEEEKTDSFDTAKVNLGTDDGSAGYSVFVTSSADFIKVIPKIQYIYSKNVDNLNVGKIDFNIKQITEDNVKILNKGRCLISKDAFDTYAKTVAEFSNYKMDQAQSNMSFKTAGIFPLNYNCSQGLSSVQITIADDSVYTSYSFEDLIVQPPSDEYMTQYIKDSLLPKKSVGSLNPINPQRLSNIKTAVGYTK